MWIFEKKLRSQTYYGLQATKGQNYSNMLTHKSADAQIIVHNCVNFHKEFKHNSLIHAFSFTVEWIKLKNKARSQTLPADYIQNKDEIIIFEYRQVSSKQVGFHF